MEEENGIPRSGTSSTSPPLPPYPKVSQLDSGEESKSDESDEDEGDVFDEFDKSHTTPKIPVPLKVNSENSDGITDHMVEQIELFFSSRFVRASVCQCHATLTDPMSEKPTKGVLLLQSFLDRQLPTQVNAARLVLCVGQTFHVLWSKPVFVTGPHALTIKENAQSISLSPDTRIDFSGNDRWREDFLQAIIGALQRMRINVSQDKSARKKAIKEYRKSQKAKLKVNKNHISIPCEFSHVTRFTHKHLSCDGAGAEVS